MATLLLSVSTKRPTNYLTFTFETTGGKTDIAQRVVNYLERIISGNESAQSSSVPPTIAISVQNSMVQASGTITFSAAATANDTLIINGVTFTAKASGAGANEFNVGLTATASATNLAASINASVTALVSGYVTASSALGVVTVTSAFYGTSGNQATIAEGVDSGSVITVSGARLTAGANDSSAKTLTF
jgi:phage tail sheath gpL-like